MLHDEGSSGPASREPWVTRRLDDDVFDYMRDQGAAAGKSLGRLLKSAMQPGAFVVETYVPNWVSVERLNAYGGAIKRPGEPGRLGPSACDWLVARLHAVLTSTPESTLVVPDPMSSGTTQATDKEYHRQVGIEPLRHDDGDYYVLRSGDNAPERIFHAIESAGNAWMEFGAVTTAPVPAGTIDAEELSTVAHSATHLFQTVYDGDSWLFATRT